MNVPSHSALSCRDLCIGFPLVLSSIKAIINWSMAGVCYGDCGFRYVANSLCLTQTSIHLTVVTGERLFGDLFKTMLGGVGAK